MHRRTIARSSLAAALALALALSACSTTATGDDQPTAAEAGDAAAARESSPPAGDAGTQPETDSGVDDGGVETGNGAVTAGSGWMGTNLGVAAAFAEWAFIDAFKFSRPWVSGVAAGEGRQPVWNDKRPLDLDDAGWVRSLLPDQIARTAMLTGPLPTRPAGRYVVLYEGQGELSYTAGASLVESGPGRDVLDVVDTAEIAINLVATDPDDYIRNIRVIMPGGVYATDPATLVMEPDADRSDYLSFEEHYESLIFHPHFLASLQGYGSVRYMNWMLTNGSIVSEWDDRPKLEDARWTVDGVPVEIMVELSNRTATNPWFTLPHLATDEYVRNFAVAVRDNLLPGLTPYVEYSNEVWNTQFAQHEYSREQGLAAGLDDEPFAAAIAFYGRRSSEIFAVWEEVYGGGEGFVAVLGSKTSDPDAVSRLALESGEAAGADLLAVAGYFGGRANWANNCDEVAAMSIDEFFDYLVDDSVPRAIDGIGRQIDVADDYGIALGIYEGGQHLRVNGCDGDDAKKEAIGDLFDAANRDPRMGDVYLEFFAAVDLAGVDLFSHYTNTGAWTRFGRFGAREHLLQSRSEMPKYDAIMTYAEQS